MNKLKIITLAVLGGVDTTVFIFTPIILAVIWISIAGFNMWSYLFYGLGLLATLFRAIKIGFMQE